VAFLLIASACSGGVRPTLTSDQLVESDTLEEPPEFVESAEEGAPNEAPTVVPEAPAPVATDNSDPTLDIEQLRVEVIETFPHDPTAFTQGLELDNGVLLESTGNWNDVSSDMRRVDPGSGQVAQQEFTPRGFFGEGLTKVGDQIIQLTWQDNTAFFWDASSFQVVKEVTYDGEGWGLCYDGTRLLMTDGLSELIFRDPTTFAETGRVRVTYNGQEVFNLNELECVDGVVWANVWQTDLILRIDPASGVVTALVDASALARPVETPGATLNGIAWDETTQSFYVTGKLWPTMYRVNFVPAGG